MPTAQQQTFIDQIAGYVIEYAPQYGVMVNSPIIAQAILESGWGTSDLARHHNYFGLKARKNWTGATYSKLTNEEYEPGHITQEQALFCAFSSMEAGVKGYFEFLFAPGVDWYDNLKGVTDPVRYCELIKEDGYATSSTYVQQLKSLIGQYDLTSYDRKDAAMAKPSWINEYHGNYNITKRTTPIKYIVLHYVGNGTSAAGNAKNNCIYFSGGNRNASAHYFVDDGGIWEYADPDQYYTWHCGDGGGRYGISNANSIGIEVCQDGDLPYTEAEIGHLTKLVPYLMQKYNVDAAHVVRHYDASRKLCPYYYAKRQDAWDALKARITNGTGAVTMDQLSDHDIARFWEYMWSGDMSGENCYTKLAMTYTYIQQVLRELTRTDDPTGRGAEMTTHDHVKWMAKGQQELLDIAKENNRLLKQLVA